MIGILNIVFGVLGILILPISMMSSMMPLDEQLAAENPVWKQMAEDSAYQTVMLVDRGLGAIASIMLVIAGMGLCQFKPYGRTLSIGYGVYCISLNVCGMFINYLYVLPGLMRDLDSTHSLAVETNAETALYAMGLGSCLGFVYPVLLLYFMYRPKMVEAFET